MPTSFSLLGKKVVLTGAAGFIGKYFAEALLAAEADKVILIDQNKDELVTIAANLEKAFGPRCVTVPLDLYDTARVSAEYETIQNSLGTIDVLINNAFDYSQRTGFNTRRGHLTHATPEQIQSSFQSGAYWAVQSTQEFGLKMKRRGRGSIINICSMYSFLVPSPRIYEGTDKLNPPGFSMAKHALLGFTRYSAAFLGPEVRVNAISPGTIPNLENQGPNAISEDNPVLRRLQQRVVLGRMGHPRDLAGALIFLASDASGYITGHNLIIDGGLSITSY